MKGAQDENIELTRLPVPPKSIESIYINYILHAGSAGKFSPQTDAESERTYRNGGGVKDPSFKDRAP